MLPALLGAVVTAVVVYYALPLSLFAAHPIAMSGAILIFSTNAVSSVHARKQAKDVDTRCAVVAKLENRLPQT